MMIMGAINLRLDYLYALLLGVLHTLIFAPFNLLPVIFITFSGFIYLISRAFTKWQAMIVGWLFGFSHSLSSLYWIHNALLVESDKFAFMIPVVLLVLPAFLGVFYIFIAWVTYKIRYSQMRRIIAFASALTVAEIVRTNFYLPFAWNLTAHSTAYYEYFLQFSFFVGAYGMTFLLGIAGGMFYTRSCTMVMRSIYVMIFVVALGICKIIYFSNAAAENDYAIRIVQPSNEHHLGYKALKKKAFERLAELSLSNQPENLKYIIWPEAAYPYSFYQGASNIDELNSLVPKDGLLIFGVDFVNFSRFAGETKIYNSMLGLDEDGKIAFRYDKSILVPFGEYIPFKPLLRNLSSVVNQIYDFSPGTGEVVVDLAKFDLPKFTPLICYETIFPGWGEGESDFLLDITNNVWFGDSIGPYQHFAMVKFKAAETGKPLIRVANNGISAAIDKFGRVKKSIRLNSSEYIDIYTVGGKISVKIYFLKEIFLFLPICLLFLLFCFEKREKM